MNVTPAKASCYDKLKKNFMQKMWQGTLKNVVKWQSGTRTKHFTCKWFGFRRAF